MVESGSCDAASHTGFFPGCALRTLAPSLSNSVFDWLESEQIASIQLMDCCGMPLKCEGHTDSFLQHGHALIDSIEAQKIESLVVVCPSCYRNLKDMIQEMSKNISVISLASILVEKKRYVQQHQLSEDAVVAIHDVCPDRKEQHFAEQMRILLKDVSCVEMEHNRSQTMCCGIGYPFYKSDWETKQAQILRRRKEAQEVGATHIVSPCVNCSVALSMGSGPLQSVHYLELLFGESIPKDVQFSPHSV